MKSHGLPSLYDVEFPPDAVIEVGNSTYGLTQKFSRFRLVGLSKPQSVTARSNFFFVCLALLFFGLNT